MHRHSGEPWIGVQRRRRNPAQGPGIQRDGSSMLFTVLSEQFSVVSKQLSALASWLFTHYWLLSFALPNQTNQTNQTNQLFDQSTIQLAFSRLSPVFFLYK